MKKITFSIVAVALIFILSGCYGFKKMIDNSDTITRSVSPDPLEMHAGKVPISVTVKFPEKYFHKLAYVIVTPTLKSDDGKVTHEFPSETLIGENILESNPKVLFKTGQIKYGPNESDVRSDTTYQFMMDYDPAYRMSDLELVIGAKKGLSGELADVVSVKIADGIITTPELVDGGLIVDNGKQGNTGNGVARTMEVSKSLDPVSNNNEEITIFYPLQKSNLTSKEKRREDISNFVEEVKKAKDDKEQELVSFTIASYASPEGPEELNSDLVTKRGETTQNFMSKTLKKAEVEGSDDDKFFTRKTTPTEDWEGFKAKVEASNITDKALILKVLSMNSDPVKRETEIKNMSKVYDELRDDILPQLRRSEIYATFKTEAKTEAELIILGKSNPGELSQNELFYAAQSAEGADKETIYKSYIAKYPQDWQALNNLAVYYIRTDQLNEAETYLQKAENIEANQNTILNNFGVVYWAKGDLTKAKEFFDKAYGVNATDEIGYNLGVLQIKNAEYDEAVKSFGGTASFNKALAQVLTGNSSGAEKTLKSISSEEGYYYYLLAVIAAQQTDENKLYSNLEKAIKADASFKEYARNDMEFKDYLEKETFKGIVD